MAKSEKKKFDDEIRENLKKSALRMSATIGTGPSLYELDMVLNVLGQKTLMSYPQGDNVPAGIPESERLDSDTPTEEQA